MLKNGLYEQIINKAIASELATTDKLSQTAPIDEAEAAKIGKVKAQQQKTLRLAKDILIIV